MPGIVVYASNSRIGGRKLRSSRPTQATRDCFKMSRAGRRAQWLRALPDLTEAPGLGPAST